MRVLPYLYAIIFFVGAQDVWATSELTTPDEVVEAFFSQISRGDVDKAFAQLFLGSSLARTDPLGVNQLPSSASAIMKAAGPMLDYEKIDSCAIGSRTVRLTYFQNLSLRPLTWIFYYYRNTQGWTLTYLQWNGQYEGISSCK